MRIWSEQAVRFSAAPKCSYMQTARLDSLACLFFQFHKQTVQGDTTPLVSRPLNLLVAELRVEGLCSPNCFLADSVTLGRDENLERNLTFVCGVRLFIHVSVTAPQIQRLDTDLSVSAVIVTAESILSTLPRKT